MSLNLTLHLPYLYFQINFKNNLYKIPKRPYRFYWNPSKIRKRNSDSQLIKCYMILFQFLFSQLSLFVHSAIFKKYIYC